MGNCIRTEMWKAFHNKMMRSALLIGFILVIADLVQTAITVSDLGASYAHSPGGYDGHSLFGEAILYSPLAACNYLVCY